MTVLHTGWTKKFGENYDSIFGGKKPTAAKAKDAKSGSSRKKAARKKSAKAKR